MRSKAGRLALSLLLGTLLVGGRAGVSNAASPVDTSAQATPAVSPSIPTGTLTVTPPIISLSVAPGSSASAAITLRAGILETISLQADGLGQGTDGSFTFVSPGQDASAYSARSMLTVSPTTVQMQSGQERQVTVNVAVPSNAGSGTRYAILQITGVPGTGTENVGIGVQLGVPLLITMANTSATPAGVVEGLSVDSSGSSGLAVSGDIKNTGNTHYGAAPNQITASAVVYDSSNRQVADSRAVLQGNSIVPTFSRDFSIAIGATKNLAAGHYRVQVTATLQNGTALGTAALDFDLADGQVAGATAVAAQNGNSGGSGSEGGLLLVALVAGLGGALFSAVIAVWSRRRTPRASA